MQNENLFDVSVIVTSKEKKHPIRIEGCRQEEEMIKLFNQFKFTRCVTEKEMIKLLNQFLSETVKIEKG